MNRIIKLKLVEISHIKIYSYSLIRKQHLKSRDKKPQYYKMARLNIHGPRQETFECVTKKGKGMHVCGSGGLSPCIPNLSTR
jgi:hypothetical protein